MDEFVVEFSDEVELEEGEYYVPVDPNDLAQCESCQ